MDWKCTTVFTGVTLWIFIAAVSADDRNTDAGTAAAPLRALPSGDDRPAAAGLFNYQLLLRNTIARYAKAPATVMARPADLDAAARVSSVSGVGGGKRTPAIGGKASLTPVGARGNAPFPAERRVISSRSASIGAGGARAALEVPCDITVRGDNWGNGGYARINLGDTNHALRAVWGDGVRIGTFGVNDAIVVKQVSGNVGIGTADPGKYKLAVEGKVGAREVVVTLSEWPDFVFRDGYTPPSLDSVSGFIKRNGRLEGIPSEREIASDGVPIGEMQAKLLQKIEELTLYVIELNDKNRRLANDLRDLERRMRK